MIRVVHPASKAACLPSREQVMDKQWTGRIHKGVQYTCFVYKISGCDHVSHKGQQDGYR